MMVACPVCNGQGGYKEEVIAGYASREMAIDACDMAYEGQPVYEEVEVECNFCYGSGEVSDEESKKYMDGGA
jgi:DnaJ-class molecular chaperone